MPGESHAVSPIRVLVVEDNPVDATLTRYALSEVKQWDVNLNVVEDGEQALFYLDRKGKFSQAPRPDLVILDLNLPKRNGKEVLQFIRADPNLRAVPVIILSSPPRDVIREEVKSADAQPNCYFTRPLGLDEFLALGEKMHDCYLRARRFGVFGAAS